MSWGVVAATTAHYSTLFVDVLGVAAAIVGSAAGGVAAWLGVRRKTSGRIGTSEADILWQQSAAIRDYQGQQIEKLSEQRDKLIDSQANQVLPLISGVIETLKQLGVSVSALLSSVEAGRIHDTHVVEALQRNQALLAEIQERLGHAENKAVPGSSTFATPAASGPNASSAKG